MGQELAGIEFCSGSKTVLNTLMLEFYPTALLEGRSCYPRFTDGTEGQKV